MTLLLQDLLAASAARNPQGIALIDRSRTLTYGELERQSNGLAQALRARGVVRGDRVGIDLEKSLEAIVAIFGILKAGAAYVPIDPRAPARRAAFLARDCAMRALVTSRARLTNLRTELDPLPEALLIDGGDWSADAAPPPGEASEHDLAYILYTSGSTGEPKGVMISHRASLAFVNWAVRELAPHAGDRFASHAPLHFDLSVLDIFAAVAAGASISLVPAATAPFPRSLADWIEGAGITVWYSVPSALVQLVLRGGLERHGFRRLRLALFAGEVFPVAHLRGLMRAWPAATFYNLYGPTETNVCTAYRVPAELPAGDAPLPVGRACAGTEVFDLDGELYVRGPTLMQGYWNRPRESAAALLADPRDPGAGARVYRTGDLVRRDPAGDWHFLGRRDSQVKSRGYRIELGEVEAALRRHPAVAEAAVLAVPHPEFGCVLRAAVVARPGAALAGAELAAFCAAQLPPYMVPAEFSLLEALPLTSTGKLDRAALQRQSV
jgi:amino acid adenylation domain-containing protein